MRRTQAFVRQIGFILEHLVSSEEGLDQWRSYGNGLQSELTGFLKPTTFLITDTVPSDLGLQYHILAIDNVILRNMLVYINTNIEYLKYAKITPFDWN